MTDAEKVQEEGSSDRLYLGIDGTMGDAQDVDHPFLASVHGAWCRVCGLAASYYRHNHGGDQRAMTERDAMEAANGHIEIDSYTVTYGQTQVKIQREGAMWRVVALGPNTWGPRFPEGDHEAMMATALEYAKRVDLARQAVRAAKEAERGVDEWLDAQVYREPSGGSNGTS